MGAIVSETQAQKKMSRVWIANYAGHEYLPAAQYGSLKYITKGYISFSSLDRLKFHIATQISESQPNDFLLLSGTTIISVIAALIWFAMHGKIRLLNWDKKALDGRGDYREMVITKENMTHLLSVLNGTDEGDVA